MKLKGVGWMLTAMYNNVFLCVFSLIISKENGYNINVFFLFCWKTEEKKTNSQWLKMLRSNIKSANVHFYTFRFPIHWIALKEHNFGANHDIHFTQNFVICNVLENLYVP